MKKKLKRKKCCVLCIRYSTAFVVVGIDGLKVICWDCQFKISEAK